MAVRKTITVTQTALMELVVDGVSLPIPAVGGVTLTREKIWSDATGRMESGVMKGKIIAIKGKLVVRWPPITVAQAAAIEGVASNVDKEFVAVRFRTVTGETRTINAYFGTPSYTIQFYAPGARCIYDASVEIIEQ